MRTIRVSTGARASSSTRRACSSLSTCVSSSTRSASGKASSIASFWLWKTSARAAPAPESASAAARSPSALERVAEAEVDLVGELPPVRFPVAVVELEHHVRDRLELEPDRVDHDLLASVRAEAGGHVPLRVIPLEAVEGRQEALGAGEEQRQHVVRDLAVAAEQAFGDRRGVREELRGLKLPRERARVADVRHREEPAQVKAVRLVLRVRLPEHGRRRRELRGAAGDLDPLVLSRGARVDRAAEQELRHRGPVGAADEGEILGEGLAAVLPAVADPALAEA